MSKVTMTTDFSWLKKKLQQNATKVKLRKRNSLKNNEVLRYESKTTINNASEKLNFRTMVSTSLEENLQFCST